MEITGWVSGQVFVQTVDEAEVRRVSEFLSARSIAFQVLTMTERMHVTGADPAEGVSSDRYSIAVHLAGFPQVVAPVLADLMQRAHSGDWDAPLPS